MKNKTVLIWVLALLALVGCRKDFDGKLRLMVEGMDNGSKMTVDGGLAYWATGDRVRINGQTVIVSIDESAGTVTASSAGEGFAAPYYGIYPASIYAGNSGANYTLNLPSTYTYATATHYSRTLQNISTPMVAYTADGNSLLFKHVTAAIGVQVVNYYGFTVMVDSIIVSSNNYKLCGETTVTLGNDITVSAADATVDSTKRVKMKFDGGATLSILAGDSATVQVPVLPVGSSNKFTVDVYLHKVDQVAVAAHFSKEQASAHSMERRMMGYARTTFGGLFTVNSRLKVIISQGNLQYQASTGTWRFATEQYTSILDAAGNNVFDDSRSTQSAWIDLFGWGTSGYDHGNTYYMPYDYLMGSPSTAYGYGPKSGSNVKRNLMYDNNGDWGKNAISNGGNMTSVWHTLTKGQIDTLLTRRSASTIGGTTNARYVKAVVNNIQGLIIFPDNYVHPTGMTVPGFINTTTKGGWGSNTYNLNKWVKMEAAGAVFLPVTGRGSSSSIITTSYGNYWSATQDPSSSVYNAYCLRFYESGLSVSEGAGRYYGHAARLVKYAQ